jgi:hypothetical protein
MYSLISNTYAHVCVYIYAYTLYNTVFMYALKIVCLCIDTQNKA